MNHNIGNKIKLLRIKSKISQKELADSLGILPQTISKWENGICAPDISMLPDISLFFGISIDELFSPEKNESENDSEDNIERLYREKKWKEVSETSLNHLRKFPHSYKICEVLLSAIMKDSIHYYSIPDKVHIQAINIAKRMLNECPDSTLKQKIIYNLCAILYKKNRTEEADFYYAYLNSATYSRESLDMYRYKGEELKSRLNSNLDIWYSMLAMSFSTMAYHTQVGEESIYLLKKASEYFELSYNTSKYSEYLHMHMLTLLDISISYAILNDEKNSSIYYEEAHKFAVLHEMEDKFIKIIKSSTENSNLFHHTKKFIKRKDLFNE